MPFVEYPADLDLKNQSFVVPGSKKEGRSGIYKSSLWPVERLAAPGEPRTLVELFDQSVARHPNLALFLRRNVLNSDKFDEEPVYGKDLIPTSYAAVQARRDAIGSALLGLERSGRLTSAPTEKHPVSPPEITFPNIPSFGNDNRAKNGARRGWAVGVWSKNREEWQVVDIAAQSYGLVSVSLYETLGPDVGKYIINHCPLPIVFASANHLTELLKIAPECPTLRVIVCMDKLSASQRKVYNEWAATVNVEFLGFAELELYGQTEGVKCEAGVVPGIPEEHELDLERIVTISYTSGTTGDPKGVVLTNRNFTRAIISNALGANIGLIGTEWRFLSYLPLSHIYERFLQLLVIYCDGTIGFTTGDTLRLLEDAQIIKPHYMPGVPRIFNRLHAAIKAQMDAGGLKGALLTRAVNTKLAAWKEKGQVTHAVYDALVFRKIKALLGGEILFLSSGSAPLAGDVHQMIKVAFATDAIQGFGMTETVGTCSKGIAWDVDAVGTCGPLQPCNEAVLMDVPEMGYTSNDKPNPRGELCLRGENITPGYLHDPVNTAKTIDSEGWMHTGDVAEFDSAGRLKIIDRIKNVVKLSQGEYVALEKLEGMYALNPVFAQLLVHGDSTRSSLIGVGVLDPVNATGLIKSLFGKTVAPTDLASIDKYAQDKRFKEAVLASLGKISKKYKLNGFETIKAVHLTATPFPESILTPTMKVKRAQAAKMYKAEIDAAYQDAEGGKTDSFAKF